MRNSPVHPPKTVAICPTHALLRADHSLAANVADRVRKLPLYALPSAQPRPGLSQRVVSSRRRPVGPECDHRAEPAGATPRWSSLDRDLWLCAMLAEWPRAAPPGARQEPTVVQRYRAPSSSFNTQIREEVYGSSNRAPIAVLCAGSSLGAMLQWPRPGAVRCIARSAHRRRRAEGTGA